MVVFRLLLMLHFTNQLVCRLSGIHRKSEDMLKRVDTVEGVFETLFRSSTQDQDIGSCARRLFNDAVANYTMIQNRILTRKTVSGTCRIEIGT